MTGTSTRTIRAVEWTLEAAGRLQRTVTALPTPASGEILVATRVGAISPGTERILLHGASPSVGPTSYPHQPGYLNVVEIIDASDRTLIGERGIAILGHRDHALIPYERFLRIPPGISDELALLGVLAADARHAVEVAAVETDEDCLVLGGGILGVLTAWELCHRSCGTLRLVERDRKRLDLLNTIHFPKEVTVSERPGRYPFDTAFDCANTPAAFEAAQRSVRPGGSIVLIADGSHEEYVLAGEFFSKGLYIGKPDSHPDLRAFLAEYFARGEERDSLIRAAFRCEVRFDEFPQAYLQVLLAPPEEREGLVPRVVYERGA